MVASIFPTDTPLTQGVGSKGQTIYFSESSHVAYQRGSCMVWEINMGVCPRLDFDNIILFDCLGYNFNIYVAFEFYAIQ